METVGKGVSLGWRHTFRWSFIFLNKKALIIYLLEFSKKRINLPISDSQYMNKPNSAPEYEEEYGKSI